MPQAPTFSVIIPTYNRGHKIGRTLESLNAQIFLDFEVLLCDDGSTDNTEKVVEQFRQHMKFRSLHYFFNENWGGPARPRNNGLGHAAAEWICYLDSDDTWHPEKLQEILPHLTDSDLIYHDFDLVGINGLKTRHRARTLKQPVFEDLMVNGHNGCIINSGVAIRRDLAQQLGGCRESRLYIGVEDADLWLRASRLTDRFTHIRKPLGTYYTDEGNLTAYNERMVTQLEALFAEHAVALPQPRQAVLARRSHHYHIARIRRMMGQDRQALGLLRTSIYSSTPEIVLRSAYWMIAVSLKMFIPFKRRAAPVQATDVSAKSLPHRQ